MCGICGVIYNYEYKSSFESFKRACDVLKHRGPDDAGFVFINAKNKFIVEATSPEFSHKNPGKFSTDDDEFKWIISRYRWNIALGHRRLAIVDLSRRAHQPMSDVSKRIWVTFNGEIYNYRELRADLGEYNFVSDSDTEVLVYAYKKWGIDFVEKLKGMFAIALLDLEEMLLIIYRDKIGAKPLYYMNDGYLLSFSSEIKSILQITQGYEYDISAVYEYLTFQNLVTSKTFFKNIYLLEPGSYMVFDINGLTLYRKRKYWDFCFTNDYSKSFDWYARNLREILELSVKKVATFGDVECGSYLSGGMDTGSIVAIASKIYNRLKTFTIGFDTRRSSGIERAFDERENAELIAWYFNTEHYEAVLKEGDLEACLNNLVWHLEEPRLGQSYPNYYAAKLAGRFVKVVLSGIGGDELLGGYPWRYYKIAEAKTWEEFLEKYYIYWSTRVLDKKTLESLFLLRSEVPDTFGIFRDVFEKSLYSLKKEDNVNLAMYFDAKTFLQSVLLIEDKLGMASSVETRYPLVYEEFMDFAQRIPWKYKLKETARVNIDENEVGVKNKYYIRTNNGKFIFREAMKDVLPEKVLWNIKQGFSAPDSNWFRGRSVKLIADILKMRTNEIFSLLDYKTVSRIVEDHMKSKRNYRLFLWSLLYISSFLRVFECS